jgi:hypothetical protein
LRGCGFLGVVGVLCLLSGCLDLHRAFPPLPDHKPPPPGQHLGADDLPKDWRTRYRKLGRKEKAQFDALEAERRQIEIWMKRATPEEAREEEERIEEIRRLERLQLGGQD